jgi:hypothetical protein
MEDLRSAMVDTFVFAIRKDEGSSLSSVLMGAAAYLERSLGEPGLSQVMEAASRDACRIHKDSNSRSINLGFFSRLWRFRVPDDLQRMGCDPRIFRREILRCAPRFAPYLLTCEEEDVRKGALSLLQELVADGQDSTADDEYAEQTEKMAAGVCRCCMVWIQRQVKDRAVYPKARIEQIQHTLLAYMDQFQPQDEADGNTDSLSVAFTGKLTLAFSASADRSGAGALEGLDSIIASSPEPMSTGDDGIWDGSDVSDAE